MTQIALSITSVTLQVIEALPPKVLIRVEGEVPTPGWSGFVLEHAIHVVPPADGIYQAKMIGKPPAEPVPEVVTPFAYDELWEDFPPTLEGLRVASATNEVTGRI